jgi:serine/threonine protein kinase
LQHYSSESWVVRCSKIISNLRQLIQVAKALEHLHHYNVVHGHIHPVGVEANNLLSIAHSTSHKGNIFVTGQGHATLADASVYTLACRFKLHSYRPVPLEISSIYQAPELLWPGTDAFVQPAKPSDVYAFASTILAVSQIPCLRSIILPLNVCAGFNRASTLSRESRSHHRTSSCGDHAQWSLVRSKTGRKHHRGHIMGTSARMLAP